MNEQDNKALLESLMTGRNMHIGQLILDNHGTMTINNGSGSAEQKKVRPDASAEQIARALVAINGRDKVLSNYQLWLGACCLLMNKYGFPKNLERCCEHIARLPFGEERLELECKYDSIRKFSYLKFVKEDVDKWDEYEPQEDEKRLFYGCQYVVQELDKAIQEVTD